MFFHDSRELRRNKIVLKVTSFLRYYARVIIIVNIINVIFPKSVSKICNISNKPSALEQLPARFVSLEIRSFKTVKVSKRSQNSIESKTTVYENYCSPYDDRPPSIQQQNRTS